MGVYPLWIIHKLYSYRYKKNNLCNNLAEKSYILSVVADLIAYKVKSEDVVFWQITGTHKINKCIIQMCIFFSIY